MRHPPENAPNARFCASSSKPRPLRIRAARAGAAWASMSTRRVWMSAMRSGSLAISASARSAVRSPSAGKHEVDQLLRASRRLLLDAAEPGVSRRGDRAALGRELAADQPEESGLAGAIASDEPGSRAARQRRGRAVDQQSLAEPVGQVVDMKHCGVSWPAASRVARRPEQHSGFHAVECAGVGQTFAHRAAGDADSIRSCTVCHRRSERP